MMNVFKLLFNGLKLSGKTKVLNECLLSKLAVESVKLVFIFNI